MLGRMIERIRVRVGGGGSASTLALAARVFKPAVWKELKHRAPDWREVFRHCAEMKSVSEAAFMEELGKKLGCPVISPVPPLSFEAMSRGAVNLSEACRAAYIPLMQGAEIVACVCLDPAAIPVKWRELGVPLYLGIWPEIREALGASEERYHNGLTRREREMSVLAEKVIDLAVAEAGRFGAETISFVQDRSALHYQFRDPSGHEFQGSIDARVAGAVLGALDQLTLAPMGENIRNVGGVSRVVRVMPGGAGERICVCGLQGKKAPGASSGAPEPKGMGAIIPFPSQESTSDEIVSRPEQSPLVVFIDDNPIFAKVLERFLRRNGMAVRHFERAAAAFAALNAGSCKPELLVCDVHMPEMDGDEFIARLRERAEFAPLPVMMLSSDDSAERRLNLYLKGADACHSKTEDPRILCAVAKRLMERRKAA